MLDWEDTLRRYKDMHTVARLVGWAFSKRDIDELKRIHKAGKYRKRIEDLLTDCNFHFECGRWHNGNYEEEHQ